ncbi:MAG: hypothetical protein UHX92_00775 [Acutalibacteraceae bacterium]|nr:hypothetical protein [Acutalibacteraceae bacterium]
MKKRILSCLCIIAILIASFAIDSVLAIDLPNSNITYDFSSNFDTVLTNLKTNATRIGEAEGATTYSSSIEINEGTTAAPSNVPYFTALSGIGGSNKSSGYIINNSNAKYNTPTSISVDYAVPVKKAYTPVVIYAEDATNYYGVYFWLRPANQYRFHSCYLTIPKDNASAVQFSNKDAKDSYLVYKSEGGVETIYDRGIYSTNIPYGGGYFDMTKVTGIDNYCANLKLNISTTGTAGDDGYTGISTVISATTTFDTGAEGVGTFTVTLNQNNSITQANAKPCAGFFDAKGVQIYLKSISVDYDISAYEEEYYDSITSPINEKISTLMKKDVLLIEQDYNTVASILSDYNALEEGAKKYVDEDYAVIFEAYERFKKGAYFYDDFEGTKLNWQLKTYNGTFRPSQYESNKQKETDNTPQTTDPNENYFWGIASEKKYTKSGSNVTIREAANSNHGLSLPRNTSGLTPSYHYVLASPDKSITQNGIGKVQSADFSLFYAARQLFRVIDNTYVAGFITEYTDENNWKGYMLNGADDFCISLKPISSTSYNNGYVDLTNGTDVTLFANNTTKIVGNVAAGVNQFIPISLEYDTHNGKLKISASIKLSDGSVISDSVEVDINANAQPDNLYLLVNGSNAENMPFFDNVSVAYDGVALDQATVYAYSSQVSAGKTADIEDQDLVFIADVSSLKETLPENLVPTEVGICANVRSNTAVPTYNKCNGKIKKSISSAEELSDVYYFKIGNSNGANSKYNVTARPYVKLIDKNNNDAEIIVYSFTGDGKQKALGTTTQSIMNVVKSSLLRTFDGGDLFAEAPYTSIPSPQYSADEISPLLSKEISEMTNDDIQKLAMAMWEYQEYYTNLSQDN